MKMIQILRSLMLHLFLWLLIDDEEILQAQILQIDLMHLVDQADQVDDLVVEDHHDEVEEEVRLIQIHQALYLIL